MLYRPDDAARAERLPVMPAACLAGFCRTIGAVLADLPDDAAPAAVARHLPGLLANPMLFSAAERTMPPGSYGRHCVFACPQERFSVLAMVWPAGFTSPIHDHATWCALGVYEGCIEEHRYRPASDDAEESRAVPEAVVVHHPGAVAHLPVNAPNIHAMHNPTGRTALSIHVYGGDSRKLGPNLRRVWSVRT